MKQNHLQRAPPATCETGGAADVAKGRYAAMAPSGVQTMPKYGMETETRARRAGWPTWRWTCVTTLRAEMRGRFDDLKRWMLAIEAEIGRVKDGKDRNESATQ